MLHEKRLAKVLRRALLAVIAAPAAVAYGCSSTEDPATSVLDASSPEVDVEDANDDRGLTGKCAPVALDAQVVDPDGSCSTFMMLPCGMPATSTVSGCLTDVATCQQACQIPPNEDAGVFLFGCQLSTLTCSHNAGPDPDAAVIFECITCTGGSGRRPRGLDVPRTRRATTPLGDYFASLAHLEAASVVAFDDLGRSLASIGAPKPLRCAAERAKHDERRHARITARLARRFGGTPAKARVRTRTTPSLEELLVDDAVEGCIGESYGALVAMWQAEHANDAEVRRAMRVIAEDETRHAALAWSFLRWGVSRLDDSARRRVRERLDAATASLRLRHAKRIDDSVVRLAGHPPPSIEHRLIAEFRRVAAAESVRAFG